LLPNNISGLPPGLDRANAVTSVKVDPFLIDPEWERVGRNYRGLHGVYLP